MLLELVMIVKDSGQMLQPVLENIKPYINYWTILDTGSTDGTQQVVTDTLKDVDGQLFEEPFIDFLITRNRSLELSSKKCLYTIILDDSYFLRGGENLIKFLKDQTQDCFNIKIIDDTRNTAYFSNRIIRSQSGKRYEKYRIHEAIPDGIASRLRLEGTSSPRSLSRRDVVPPGIVLLPSECFVADYRDYYHTYRSQKRHRRDIEMLLEHHREDPDDSRILYYLACTYLAMNKHKKASKYYKKLLEIPESRENEVFEAMMYIANRNREQNVEWSKVETQLFNIVKKFRYRLEPVFLLFMREYNEGNITRAYQYIKLCYSVKEPVNYTYEYNYSIYRIYIPYFYIDLSMKLGMVDQGVEALKQILQLYPHNQRFLNIKYVITQRRYQPQILSNGRTVVIHSGGMIEQNPWNPNNISNIGSGSEIMAINLSKMLVKRGYRVILFGHFIQPELNLDYEGMWDGVEYYDYTAYNEFIQRYYVDYLIVSRRSDNLVYYDNIKNVYLWVHDIYPQDAQYIFQTHPEKFKGMLCLSEWHRQLNIREYKLPEKMVKCISNAIFFNRFRKTSNKIPHSFIWTSDIYRGLEYAIEMFKSIKLRYPDSTFKIFGKRYNLSAELSLEIANIASLNRPKGGERVEGAPPPRSLNPTVGMSSCIEFYDRVSQEELTVELLQSDVWLYPNNFEETYCISAVEAAAAGCLVCCNVHAGLLTTVGDRGAVIKGRFDKEKLLNKLYNILDNNEEKKRLIKMGLEFASTQDFEVVTDNFISNLSS